MADNPGEEVVGAQGTAGLPMSGATSPREDPIESAATPLTGRRGGGRIPGRPPERFSHSASRTLLCPFCATQLGDWLTLPIVGDDGGPITLQFGGDLVEVTPALLVNPVTELQYQLSRLRAYRLCPNGHRLPLQYGRRPVLLLPVMGPTGSGKTLFLAGLHQLIMRGAFARLGWDITLEDAPGVAEYAAKLEGYVATGMAEKTLDEALLIYRLRGLADVTDLGQEGFNIVLFDLPGERYMSAPGDDPRVLQVGIADGLIFIVDSDDLAGTSGIADYAGNYAVMLSRLSNQLDDDHPYFRRSDRASSWQYLPVGIGIGKSDRITSQLTPELYLVTDGDHYVYGEEIDEVALDSYALSYLYDRGDAVGRTVLARLFERFIFTSLAFVSSFDDSRMEAQAVNTMYLFARLLRHVVEMVNLADARPERG